ncbi:MAG: ribonuclease Y [Spirochaetales bacterium]|jgi:ribonucrease Y|nr:ribonuclease Y [Spirochaetales bacterium]
MKIALYIVLPLAGIFLGWFFRWLYAKFQLSSTEQRAERLTQDSIKEAEAQKKELLLEAKDQLLRDRNQQEREFRDRRNEQQRLERRLIQKEENLERKSSDIERQTQSFSDREGHLNQREETLKTEESKWRDELERIAGISAEEAKKLIIQSMENDAKHDAQVIINKIEQEAQNTADKKAREIVVNTIQRLATDISSEITVTSVSLPSDEMKGRIIGREGRNIRTLETLTGVDIIIDDTPEAVVISCFDPVRKQIAKTSLERLISDGRIHPARIEEVVQKVIKEINQIILDEGEKMLFDLGIHNINHEGIRSLGRLHFRTSYGQNVLMHTKEVAILAGMLTAQVGGDREIAKRGAVFHDIGKGIESNGDKTHIELGVDLARKLGEDERVVNAIASHHGDVEPNCIESILVQVADAISAARPGARRETLDNYIKRLENLEQIAESFAGVDKCFAIQAGRELRIMVDTSKIDDNGAKQLAKDIAQKIENELRYPGRIKVTIIRETRIIEYAR